MAPLGVLLSGRHIHLMNVATLAGPLLLQAIILDILEVGTAILSGVLKSTAIGLGPVINSVIALPMTGGVQQCHALCNSLNKRSDKG